MKKLFDTNYQALIGSYLLKNNKQHSIKTIDALSLSLSLFSKAFYLSLFII
jgi:hypothetical protein